MIGETIVQTEAEKSAAMASAAVAPSTPASQEPYIFPWGRHKGKLLADIPIDYIRWLQRSSDGYKLNVAMQSAVEKHLSTTSFSSSQQAPSSSLPHCSSQPLSSQPPRTPLAPLSSNTTVSDGPYVLTFGKHQGKKLDDVPAEYVEWLKKSETAKTNQALAQAIAKWDTVKRVYRLGFGKYIGCSLDEVPPTYLMYLHDSDAAVDHDDLRRAFAEHKQANAMEQMSSQTASSGKKKAFSLPDDVTFDYRRFYYNGDRRSGPMWIGCHDALRYFGADAKAMVAAGLRPTNRGQRFWLHQVFAYAKHFKTTRSDTPTKALNKFKAKNHHNPRG